MQPKTPEARLFYALGKLQITRQEAADRLGVSRSLLAQYATGHHKIRRVTALAFEARCKISADWLMTGRGKMEVLTSNAGGLSATAIQAAHLFAKIPERARGPALRMLAALEHA